MDLSCNTYEEDINIILTEARCGTFFVQSDDNERKYGENWLAYSIISIFWYFNRFCVEEFARYLMTMIERTYDKISSSMNTTDEDSLNVLFCLNAFKDMKYICKLIGFTRVRTLRAKVSKTVLKWYPEYQSTFADKYGQLSGTNVAPIKLFENPSNKMQEKCNELAKIYNKYYVKYEKVKREREYTSEIKIFYKAMRDRVKGTTMNGKCLGAFDEVREYLLHLRKISEIIKPFDDYYKEFYGLDISRDINSESEFYKLFVLVILPLSMETGNTCILYRLNNYLKNKDNPAEQYRFQDPKYINIDNFKRSIINACKIIKDSNAGYDISRLTLYATFALNKSSPSIWKNNILFRTIMVTMTEDEVRTFMKGGYHNSKYFIQSHFNSWSRDAKGAAGILNFYARTTSLLNISSSSYIILYLTNYDENKENIYSIELLSTESPEYELEFLTLPRSVYKVTRPPIYIKNLTMYDYTFDAKVATALQSYYNGCADDVAEALLNLEGTMAVVEGIVVCYVDTIYTDQKNDLFIA